MGTNGTGKDGIGMGYTMNNLDGWNHRQMEQQRYALEYAVDLSHLDPTIWDHNQMEEQRWALEYGVDISYLDPMIWNGEQMYQQRVALEMEQQKFALEGGTL